VHVVLQSNPEQLNTTPVLDLHEAQPLLPLIETGLSGEPPTHVTAIQRMSGIPSRMYEMMRQKLWIDTQHDVEHEVEDEVKEMLSPLKLSHLSDVPMLKPGNFISIKSNLAEGVHRSRIIDFKRNTIIIGPDVMDMVTMTDMVQSREVAHLPCFLNVEDESNWINIDKPLKIMVKWDPFQTRTTSSSRDSGTRVELHFFLRTLILSPYNLV
jgi:hypothetical protein